MKTITKTFEITATPDVMKRFERFLSLMHYNGGHSATFAMPFDGDGSDILKTNPPPEHNEDRKHIGSFGPELEVAYNDCYVAYRIDRDKNAYKVKDGVKTRIKPNGEHEVL